MTTKEERFKTYLQYFIDGNISLDYLKGIIVRDKILKSEANINLEKFPAFLVMEGDLTEDIFDDLYYKVNSVDIKLGLTEVIGYIEQSLFAQDINLLNDMAGRFEKAIVINNDSNKRLKDELAKLNAIDQALKAQIIEAKKVYTAYDVVMSQFATSPDPVRAYTDEITKKINAELETQSAIKLQLESQALLKAEEERKASLLQAQLTQSADIVKQSVESQLTEAKAEQARQDTLYQESLVKASQSKAITESKTTKEEVTTEKKPSKAIPIIAGLGILAYLGLGGKD